MPQFDLSPTTPASVVTPPAGYYAIFLNSSDADLAYKKNSSGVSSSLVAGFANPMTTLGDVIYGGALGVATRLGAGSNGQVLTIAAGIPSWATPTTGTVTSVAQSFTGGLISVGGSPITGSGTLALTVAGTSGGIPYFSSSSTWASSGALTANALMIGGGAGTAPSTTTTGTGVLTALGVNVGSAGAFVTFNGALGTPSSGTLTNATGLPEGGLSLTDITTANTSTSAHGFFPKLTANSIYYVNNAGALTALTVGAAGTVLTGNGVTSAPTWAASSSGITVGTTTITSGTSGRLGYNNAGVYGESAAYAIKVGAATDFFMGTSSGSAWTSGSLNTGVGYEALKGITSGAANTGFGYRAVLTQATGNHVTGIGYRAAELATGQYNTALGSTALLQCASGAQNTAIGGGALGAVTGGDNVGLGYNANNAATSVTGSITIGSSSSAIFNYSAAFGMNATTTAANQLVFGAAAAASGVGVFNEIYFNGVTFTSPAPVVINAVGASGNNIAGCAFTLSGSKGTGSGTPGTFEVKTSTTLGSGTTLQSLVSRLTISGGAVTTDASTATWADALDFVFSGTTGTKFGTATTQKIAFWNKTPIVQPTTAISGATVVHIGGSSYQESDTIGGYTIAQIVQALINIGILA